MARLIKIIQTDLNTRLLKIAVLARIRMKKTKTKSNQKDDKFKFNYSPQQNASSTEEKQQQKSISPSLLPIFNTFICSYFNYKDFIPKAGLAYCFFAEINEPTYCVFFYFFLANLSNFLAYLIHLTFSDSVITPAPNACARLLASLTNQK